LDWGRFSGQGKKILRQSLSGELGDFLTGGIFRLFRAFGLAALGTESVIPGTFPIRDWVWGNPKKTFQPIFTPKVVVHDR